MDEDLDEDDEDLDDDESEIDDEIDAAPSKAVKTNNGGFFGKPAPQQQGKPQQNNQAKPQQNN